jgi:subtilisin family serine protease
VDTSEAHGESFREVATMLPVHSRVWGPVVGLILLNPFQSSQAAGVGEVVPGIVILRFTGRANPPPKELQLVPARVGISSIDQVLAKVPSAQLDPFLRIRQSNPSPARETLERTYILRFAQAVNPTDVVGLLLPFSEFEEVRVETYARAQFFGTKQHIPPDDRFPQQWNLHSLQDDRQDIDAPEAWEIERGDPSIIIAITDSGTLVNHPPYFTMNSDIERIWNPLEDVGTQHALSWADINEDDPDDDGREDNVIGTNFAFPPEFPSHADSAYWSATPANTLFGPDPFYYSHGLMVESVAASKEDNWDFLAGEPHSVCGVAPGCKVYHVRTSQTVDTSVPFDPDLIPLLGTPGDDAQAILHAALHADVINMSWGYDPGDLTLEQRNLLLNAVQTAAVDFDCVLVAAVGNTDQGATEVWFPARFSEVVGVGNMAKNLSLYVESVYGPQVGFVSVVAPVDEGIPAESNTICTPFPCVAEESIHVFGGTSAASPQVSGLAALIRSRFPRLNQQEVRDRIARSTEWYWGTTTTDTMKFGSGKVNAYRALTEWGSISANTIWDPSNTRDGKYYLSGDLTIEPGVTLTIKPGVVVKVAPDHKQTLPDGNRVHISVKGSLVINATAQSPVIFESFTDSPPTKSDWSGIQFETGSNGTLKNVVIRNAQVPIRNYAPLTISDCLIEDGVDGIQAYNDLIVRNSILQRLSASGIVWKAGNLELRNVEIRNSDYGISQSTATSTGNFLCRDSKFSHMSVKGISLSSPSSGVAIAHTEVEYSHDGIHLISQTSVAIDSCSLRGNDIGISLLVGSGALIRHCVIDSSATTGVYLVGYTDFSNSVMEVDTVRYSPTGVHFYYGSGGWIRDSRIVNNSLGLKCELNSIPVVRATRIAYGGAGVFAGEGSNPDLGHASGGTCGSGSQEGHNSIHDHSAHHVANLDPAVTVFAECNWWGGTPSPQKFYGNVDYTPHQSSDPNPSGPVENQRY